MGSNISKWNNLIKHRQPGNHSLILYVPSALRRTGIIMKIWALNVAAFNKSRAVQLKIVQPICASATTYSPALYLPSSDQPLSSSRINWSKYSNFNCVQHFLSLPHSSNHNFICDSVTRFNCRILLCVQVSNASNLFSYFSSKYMLLFHKTVWENI